MPDPVPPLIVPAFITATVLLVPQIPRYPEIAPPEALVTEPPWLKNRPEAPADVDPWIWPSFCTRTPEAAPYTAAPLARETDPPVWTVTTAPLLSVNPPSSVPAVSRVLLLSSVVPPETVFPAVRVHRALCATATSGKPRNSVPRPLSVPAVAEDPSSSSVPAAPPPWTTPENTAFGKISTRFANAPDSATAVPALPVIVPALTTVPGPTLSWTPAWPVIMPPDRFVTAPPAPRRTP